MYLIDVIGLYDHVGSNGCITTEALLISNIIAFIIRIRSRMYSWGKN